MPNWMLRLRLRLALALMPCRWMLDLRGRIKACTVDGLDYVLTVRPREDWHAPPDDVLAQVIVRREVVKR